MSSRVEKLVIKLDRWKGGYVPVNMGLGAHILLSVISQLHELFDDRSYYYIQVLQVIVSFAEPV